MPKLAMIATQGSLDWAYPPFILATAAASMGWDVGIFFTFYGLPLLKKDLKPTVSSLGNPAMPMKMPFGPEGFQNINWPIPNAITSNIPGFESMATSMMKKTFKNKGVATVEELRDIAVDMDVKLIACQMTMDVFGFKKEEFIEEAEYAGAAAYLEFAVDSDVNLFI